MAAGITHGELGTVTLAPLSLSIGVLPQLPAPLSVHCGTEGGGLSLLRRETIVIIYFPNKSAGPAGEGLEIGEFRLDPPQTPAGP